MIVGIVIVIVVIVIVGIVIVIVVIVIVGIVIVIVVIVMDAVLIVLWSVLMSDEVSRKRNLLSLSLSLSWIKDRGEQIVS